MDRPTANIARRGRQAPAPLKLYSYPRARTGSLMTRCWRDMDSNYWSRHGETPLGRAGGWLVGSSPARPRAVPRPLIGAIVAGIWRRWQRRTQNIDFQLQAVP